jgi:hypothetical protein
MIWLPYKSKPILLPQTFEWWAKDWNTVGKVTPHPVAEKETFFSRLLSLFQSFKCYLQLQLKWASKQWCMPESLEASTYTLGVMCGKPWCFLVIDFINSQLRWSFITYCILLLYTKDYDQLKHKPQIRKTIYKYLEIQSRNDLSKM